MEVAVGVDRLPSLGDQLPLALGAPEGDHDFADHLGDHHVKAALVGEAVARVVVASGHHRPPLLRWERPGEGENEMRESFAYIIYFF